LFQVSCPQLISQPGSDANNELVRWMHILETARPEGLLPGGEFILTTATFLDHAAMSERDGIVAANQFLDAIEETGAVAVAAEVLHDREHVVEVLTQAAQHRRIPVYILPNRIRFEIGRASCRESEWGGGGPAACGEERERGVC